MNGVCFMADVSKTIFIGFFEIIFVVLIIAGIAYLGITICEPIILWIKDLVNSYNCKKDNAKGIDTGVCYEVIKVKNIASTRRDFPLYCFLCDGKTGNIYQVKNGKRDDEVIFNYYEECNYKCCNCKASLTERTCDYCGWVSPDLIDMDVVNAILKEYGYHVR